MAETINKQVLDDVKSKALAEVDTFKDGFETSKTAMSAEIERIVKKYSDPTTYKTIVTDIIDDAYSQITTAYTALSTMVTQTIAQVQAQIAVILTTFTGIGSGIPALAAQISNLKDVINFVKIVYGVVKYVIETIGSIIEQIRSLVETVVKTAVQTGTNILKSVGQSITDIIEDVLEAPAQIIDDHLEKMKERATEVRSKASDAEAKILELTGRAPGEQDFITSITAFGGKETEDQDRHGIAVNVTTDVGVVIG